MLFCQKNKDPRFFEDIFRIRAMEAQHQDPPTKKLSAPIPK